MAPKKKQKVENPRPTIVQNDTITDVMHRATENVNVIMSHDAFKDIRKAEPLSIADGGKCEPYKDGSFKAAFQKDGEAENNYYTCGFNFMWINHAKRAMVGVPISSRSVEHLLSTTRIMSGDVGVLDIAVCSVQDLPSSQRGAIDRLSPPEESFALLELIRRDVDNNQTDKLTMWKKVILSLQVRIRVMPDASDRWWFEYNYRENIGEQFDALYQTTYQKVCAIIRIAAQISEKEGPGAATAARVFNDIKNGASSLTAPRIAGAENMTETFIKQCLVVRDSVFSIPSCRAIIAELDELQGHDSVLNSVYKLAAIKQVAKTAPMIEWVLDAIKDGVQSKSAFFENKLTQRDFLAGGPKNVVGAIVAKKEFLDYALGQAGKMFPHEIVSRLMEVFSSYEQYRKMKPIGGEQPPMMWMAHWPVPARLFLEFLCDTVFSFNAPYLFAFQNCSRKGRCVSSLLESGCMNEEWARIKKAVEDAAREEKVKAEMDAKAQQESDGARHEDAGGNLDNDVGEAGDSACDGQSSRMAKDQNPQEFWMRFAQETVRSRVVLKAMPETESELVEILKTSDIAKLSFSPSTHTILKVYDEKLGSEAQHAPRLRKCPHRPGVFRKCLQSNLAANDEAFAKGEMVLVFDHGKATIQNNAKKIFEGIAHHSQHYELQIEEESLTVRRKRMKTKAPLIKQTEKLLVFVADKKFIPECKRRHYSGTNRGQQWGFIALTPYSHVWRVKPEEKKDALGDAIRPVGGRAEDGGSDDEGSATDDEDDESSKDNLVPFAYHALPKLFAESMVHAFKAKGIVDFTPGDGTLAEVALEARDVLYLGICHTEVHCNMLRNRLAEQVMAAMQQESSPLYNSLCVAELKKNEKLPPPKPQKPGPKPKKKKNKNKRKKKNGKGESSAPESSESSESSSPAGGSD